jgi:hypothetical protein
MGILSRFNPVSGLKDFWQEFTRPQPYRWPVLGVSALITGTLFYPFTQETVYLPPEAPIVTYITTFAEGRTDEEIRASNIANQERKDRLAVEQAEREERVRELYRSLGRASGMDVDAIEEKLAEEKALEEAQAAESAALEAGDEVGDEVDNKTGDEAGDGDAAE